MRADEQAEYRLEMAREIEAWAGAASRRNDPWWGAVERIPAYFDALVSVSRDPALEPHDRLVVHRVIKYLLSPLDLLPEFIYGPDGFREDLVLVAKAADRLAGHLGGAAMARHGLSPDDPGLRLALERGPEDVDEDILRHLELLLEADAVAGDEDLAREIADASRLTASAGGGGAHPGEHVMVFAGPGTGKTWCIEHELARLLVEEGVDPESVLVTTFTNKAADELRVRIRDRLRESGAFGDVDGVLRRLTVSTIHAFCHALIARFHHHALFLKGTFSPMDPTRRMLFLFRRGIGDLELQPIHRDWREERARAGRNYNLDLFHFYSEVGEIFDFLSEDVMIGVEETLRLRYLEILQETGGGTVEERIIRAYPRYWRGVQDEGYLDHAMVLAYAEALLDDPHVRAHVRDRYRNVLVDEYQDTNPIQDRIFRAVVGREGRLFAVGDDDQSIYAFRGADVRNATRFRERWPGAEVRKLEKNFRSTGALVAAAQVLIRRNSIREEKALFTDNPEGTPPWRIEAPEDDLPARTAELLDRLRASKVIEDWSGVAVLFRGLTERVARYRDALEARGIPSVVMGDRHFLKRPVVRGLLGVFEMIHEDPEKLTRRKRKHRPFFETLAWTDRDRMLEAVRGWSEGLRTDRYDTLLDLFYAILDETGATSRDDVLPDLGRFSAFLAEAEEQIRSPDLLKRLGWFLTYSAAAGGAFHGPEPEAPDAVPIMTIHQSKGLQFPVVVIADAVAGTMPLHFPEDVRTRLRREMAGKEPWLDPDEEERRVLYVGMTRAERLVLLAVDPSNPSPFLDEFPSVAAPADPAAAVAGKAWPAARRSLEAPPIHAHHSQIYNYHFCPKRFLLENRHGFAGRAIPPLRAGQSLHRAVEILHRLLRDGDRVTSDRLERIFERAWIRPRGKREAAREHEELFGVFTRYAGSLDGNGKRDRIVDVELPFYVAEGDGVLLGKIDLVRERAGRLEIVEFKYHANPMMLDYPRRQLDHYSLAYPEEEPGLVVHYLAEGREEGMPRRPPGPIRDELSRTFEAIRRERFAPVPEDRKCRLCPMRYACCDRSAGAAPAGAAPAG